MLPRFFLWNSTSPDGMPLFWDFFRAFVVCKCTHLGVSSTQRVKCLKMVSTCEPTSEPILTNPSTIRL